MEKLIERLQVSDGDRELDLAIWREVTGENWYWAPEFRYKEAITCDRHGKGAAGNPVVSLEPFTLSVDAALTLLPDWVHNKRLGDYIGHGCDHIPKGEPAWFFECDDGKHTKTLETACGPIEQYTRITVYEGANPAIPICVAALKTRSVTN